MQHGAQYFQNYTNRIVGLNNKAFGIRLSKKREMKHLLETEKVHGGLIHFWQLRKAPNLPAMIWKSAFLREL
jgi:hypothetical protein